MKGLSKKIATIALAVGSFLCLSFGGVVAFSQPQAANPDGILAQAASVASETATFTGLWATPNDFNSEQFALLQYATTGAWDHTNKGTLASKVTLKNTTTGVSVAANANTVAGWSGQKWIILQGLADYNVVEIAAGGTFGGDIEIPAITIYKINGHWVTTAPQKATTSFTGFASGWNNALNGGAAQTILKFDVNPLGNAANATNLAANVNTTSVMVKYNGKTFVDLYADTTNANYKKYNINYAHGNYYFFFSIPEADLVEGATLEIEEGTPFMNVYLPAVKLVFTNGAWVEEVVINYNPDFMSITSFNHQYNEGLKAYGLSMKYNTKGFAAEGEQVMASAFTGITLNGEACKPALWGGDQLLFWFSPSKCEAGYNGYKYPTLAIEDGATITNAKGETFTLGGVTLYLVNGAWTTANPALPATSFVEVETAYGWNNNVANGIASTLLEFSNTLGNAADETNQAADTAFDVATKMKLNGKSVNEWYAEDGKTTVNYQHGGKYLQIQIPASYLELSSAEYPYLTLTIEEGAEFMNYSLPAVSLYCVNGCWVTQKPTTTVTVTTNYTGFASGWNNLLSDGKSNNILKFDVNPLGNAADATNLAASANLTSVMVKYNGKTFAKLYADAANANHTKYSISYAHGNGFFYFSLPTEDLVDGAIFEIEEGTPFMNQYLSGVKLEFDGLTQTWVPYTEINYNPDFVALNPTFNNDVNGFLILQYDTTGWAQAAIPTSYSGFTYNGNDISDLVASNGGVKFYLEHSIWFTYSSTGRAKLVAGYNGYSHPTIQIAEGATVVHEGMTYTLHELTLYLVGDKWTTDKPDDYQVAASFTDFSITGVGATHNHYYDNGTGFYRLTLDFNQGGLAFNQYASAASGVTFNGISMTFGGSPSGDRIMLVTMDSGLWIWYSEEQAAAGYKYYTHPTIHFENGATITDANGVTITYAELTLYLVNGAWTTTQPDGWSNERVLSFSEIKWNNIDYGGISEKYGLTNGAVILVGYNEYISDYDGAYANETNLISADNSIGNNITVNGVALKDIEGAYAALQSGYFYLYVPVCEYLTIGKGTDIYGYVVEETTFYFNGQWSTEEPTYTPVTFDSIHWNNFDHNGYGSIYGEESGNGTPVNGFCGLFKYSATLGALVTESNMATAYLDIGTKFKVNGVSAKDIKGAYISYNVAQEYLYFYIPFSGLLPSDMYVVTIEDGAKFMASQLEGTTYYFYDGLLHDEPLMVVTIQYGEISVAKRFSGAQEIDVTYLSAAINTSAASMSPLAWTVNGTEYFAGESLVVNESTTVIITESVEFETTYGASVRVTNDGNYGIRFESRIELESYNALLAKYGATNVKTGTYIVPKALFDMAGMSLADYLSQAQGEGADSKYVNVSNFNAEKNENGIFNKKTYEEDGYIQYYGALTNLNGSNYYTQFFGVGYIAITAGEKTITAYGLNNVMKTNRTIYDVARMAYSDTNEEYSDDEMTVLKHYLNSVAVLTYSNGNLFADTQVTGRVYESPYSVAVDGGMYVVTSAVQPKAVIVNGRKISFDVDENNGVYTFEISVEFVKGEFGSSLRYGLGEPNVAVWGADTENANDEMLAGIAQELGVTSYRVWTSNRTGVVGTGNVVTLGATPINTLKSHVKTLIDGGVNEILFAHGAFITPYDYPSYYVADKDGNELWVSYEEYLAGNYTQIYHDFSVVPDPTNEPEAYQTWLKVQYDYYVLFAAEVQAWKSEFGWTDNVVKFYFEGINEPEFQNLIHKRGTYANDEYIPTYYSAGELAKVLTDVAYYMTLAVGNTGYIATPALTNISSNSNSPTEMHGVYCDTLLAAMYDQINDGVAPTAINGITPANTNDENDYFTCLNWHPYLPWFKEEHTEMYYGEIVTEKTWWGTTKKTAKVNNSYADNWVSWNNAMYQIAVSKGDDDRPKVFFSELGVCDWGNPESGNYKTMNINESTAATVFKTLLGKASSLTFVNELTVMAFRAFDVEERGIGEGNVGMINEQGQIKQIMKEYYVIINGNDDTSSLQAKIDEYFI